MSALVLNTLTLKKSAFIFYSCQQGPVVQKLDSTIHWISVHAMDSTIGFPNTFPLYSDIASG